MGRKNSIRGEKQGQWSNLRILEVKITKENVTEYEKY